MNVLQIKEAVRKRDGYKCVKCGATNAEHLAEYGRALEVHRLVPGSLYTVEGCVTLCRPCHGPQAKRRRKQPDLANPDRGCPILIAPDLHHKMKFICALCDLRLMAYLDSLIRSAVNTQFDDLLRQEKAKIVADAPSEDS